MSMTAEERAGADLITGETVYLVTHTDRFGAASWAFSTHERAEAYAFRLASRIWREANREGEPTDDPDWWTNFYEQCPDNDIETDQAAIDAEA